MNVNPRFVWPAVMLAVSGMVAACVMAIAGVDRETIVVLLGLLVTPILGTLLAVQISHVQGAAAQVVQQTNGQQGRLLDIVEAQSRLLATMTPTPLPAPANLTEMDDRTGQLAA